MLKKLELSDYQLWMCEKIKERLTEDPYAVELSPAYRAKVEEREVISLALSELLYRLGGLEPEMKKIE